MTAVPLAAADPVVIQGSTTFARIFDPYRGMIEAISKQEVTLIPNKSMPGLIALLENRAGMAMISSSLQSELEELRRIRPGLRYDQLQAHEILNTRIAFALHPSNPVRAASLDQVRQILMGKISNWIELGGPDLPVRTVLVGGGGGVTTLVESRLLNGQSAAGPHVIYVKTPLQVIKVVQQLPEAIGFAQLALTSSQGLPELRTEKPIEQMLSLVTLGPPTAAMTDIIRAARHVAQKAI
jgi:ABC-type phosphate transport system substrate-binding protein